MQRGGHISSADKEALADSLHDLEDTLNYHLAKEYGVDPTKTAKFEKWKKSHQPFHWYVDFFPLMTTGGFDVVIGNPPFVENRIAKKEYWLLEGTFATEDVGNLYALCMERCAKSLTRSEGCFSMIVPNGLAGLDDARSIRNCLISRFSLNWLTGYAIRPAKLFDGVDQRLCVFVGLTTKKWETHVGGYRHWYGEERAHLFSTTRYLSQPVSDRLSRLPQVADEVGQQVMAAIEQQAKITVKSYYASLNPQVIHYHRSPRYWIRSMSFEPYFKSATRDRSIHHFRDLNLNSMPAAATVCCVINSSLFFFWFVTVGNGRNLTSRDVAEFPLGNIDDVGLDAITLSEDLMRSYRLNSFVRTRVDCEFQEFRPSLSKPLIDDVDSLLARHFGLSDVQLDYITNYDIKYRLGQNADHDDD